MRPGIHKSRGKTGKEKNDICGFHVGEKMHVKFQTQNERSLK